MYSHIITIQESWHRFLCFHLMTNKYFIFRYSISMLISHYTEMNFLFNFMYINYIFDYVYIQEPIVFSNRKVYHPILWNCLFFVRINIGIRKSNLNLNFFLKIKEFFEMCIFNSHQFHSKDCSITKDFLTKNVEICDIFE